MQASTASGKDERINLKFSSAWQQIGKQNIFRKSPPQNEQESCHLNNMLISLFLFFPVLSLFQRRMNREKDSQKALYKIVLMHLHNLSDQQAKFNHKLSINTPNFLFAAKENRKIDKYYQNKFEITISPCKRKHQLPWHFACQNDPRHHTATQLLMCFQF